MAKNALPPIPQPPTKEQLLDLLRKTTPPEFHEPLLQTDSEAVFRALARMFATLGLQADRGTQARYFLPSGIQRNVPASCGSKAVGSFSLNRTGPATFPLILTPGVMEIQTRRGDRVYRNKQSAIWWPGETGAKTVEFECEVLGYIGNLDHVRNSDGSLDTDLVEVVNQDGDRAGINATIGTDGTSTYIQDLGFDDMFTPSDVGMYVRIDASSVPSQIGEHRRITGFEWPQQEIPPNTGRYPRRAILADLAWVNPLDISTDVLGSFTDQYSTLTQQSGTATIIGGNVNDAIYWGSSGTFSSVIVELATPAAATWDIVWEYWNGSAWAALPGIADTTQGFTIGGTQQPQWDVPLDWATNAPTGTSLTGYFVRARLDAVTTATTLPVASRTLVIDNAPLAPATAVTWTLLDFQPGDLGLTIAAVPNAPTGGTDNDLYVLADERGIYQQDGEDCDTFRERASRLLDTVSPNAVNRAVQRALYPLGLTGRTCDVSSRDRNGDFEFPGMFFSATGDGNAQPFAFDLYGPGDLYPENPYYLMLSAQEAYGWFFVKLPYNGLGDFGAFFDDGPVLYDGDAVPPEYLGSFFESAYYDGYPVDYYGAVAGIYSVVDAIRAGGVGFTIIRG